MSFKEFLKNKYMLESYDKRTMQNSKAYKDILNIFNKHKIKVKNLMTIVIKNQDYISVIPELDLGNIAIEFRINKISSLKKEDFFSISFNFGRNISAQSALESGELLTLVSKCVIELNNYLKNAKITDFYDPDN